MTAAPTPTRPSRVIAETKPVAPRVVSSHPASDAPSAPALTMLSAYGEPEPPPQFHWSHGLILGLFILLVVGGLGIGGWYWWSHRGSAVQALAPPSSSPGTATENSSPPPLVTTSKISPAQTSPSADDEIKRLRDRRVAAKPSESAEIISALEQAEKKYPNDYRLPYELSKLSIKGVISHHEAFEPLTRAAEKAIDNGKSEDMLNDLTADKNGDFFKLSRGHHEWETLDQALRNKNKATLKTLTH